MHNRSQRVENHLLEAERALDDEPDEVTGVTNVVERRVPMPSQPEVSLAAGPAHLRVQGLPAWLLAALVLALGMLTAGAWVAAH